MAEEKKSYYAIIPANVRYDETLPPNAKLLYGEITALCNSEGYCWASNKYFAELYGVSIASIKRWIKVLIDRGYIKSQLVYKEGSKEIDTRYIQICTEVVSEMTRGSNKNEPTPGVKNEPDNNTSSFNTTSNTTDEYIYIPEKPKAPEKPKQKQFTPPTLEEVQAYCKERKNNVDAQKFFDYYNAADWFDKNGDKVKSWKQKVITWEGNRGKKSDHNEAEEDTLYKYGGTVL